MANIGEPRRVWEFEPEPMVFPIEEPSEAPAIEQPAEAPELIPA